MRWDIHDDVATTEGHVNGTCGPSVLAIDAVDNCRGGGDRGPFSRVFGDLAFPVVGPFDPLRIDTLLSVSIEADAVVGLTARIRRFGGYATDEVALAPEPFDARHHWSGSSRSVWPKSLSALGALEEVERSRRETVVLSGSLTTGVPETSLKKSGRGVGSGRCCS